MKKWIAALAIFVILGGLLTFPVYAASDEPIPPWDYQNLLGRGMDVDWSKTKSGREQYSVKAVEAFKTAGISHVRIRISEDASDALLNGLDQQVRDCLNNGIIPIIAYQADAFKNEPTEQNIRKVVHWWGTVAARYQNESHKLGFDLLIEATDELNKDPEKLNEIYERLVAEIRKTNPTRIVMISPRLRSDASYLKELKLPSMHNGYLMAEWHFYASGPSKNNDRKLWTTGTDAEKKLITDKIALAAEWQKETGLPTWVGAWMPGNYNDGNDYNISEQCAFAEFMVSELSKAGIPFAVNSDTKYYDRETNTWILEMQPVFKTIFPDKEKALKVGFNAKAVLSPAEQCTFLRDELKATGNLRPDKLWLRLNGGTISQKTMPADWTEDAILQWAGLQKEFGCPFIFVVNFNDTPENQLTFYNRLVNSGITFSGIELGNEQYLPKFADSEIKDEEVTKRTLNMTPQKYIQMCNEYIGQFSPAKLPFYVQFAPQKEGKNDYTQWNKTVAQAISSGSLQSTQLMGTIHLYERDGAGSLDVGQISAIRSLVNRPIPFAVTEFGVADKNETIPYTSYIEQEKSLAQRILAELKDGDMLLNQVLYTDYKNAGPEAFHPQYHGITPKGKIMLAIFQGTE